MRHDTILAIETSCDDTAAAVVIGGSVRSNVVSSQLVHERYGGVVPELASREHQKMIVPVVAKALEDAGVEPTSLSAVGVTYGPGLAGSLLVGVTFAKAYALGLGIPVVGVNHLEGHLYSVFLEDTVPRFPYLCLVVSGGHTQLVIVRDKFDTEVLGRTRDDAAGEAFDKVAKLLGLRYPGGPEIDKLARGGDASYRAFPRAKLDGYDFSFSGIKTSVLYFLSQFDDRHRAELLEERIADLCASFEQAVVDMLIAPLAAALDEFEVDGLAIVGGVSANTRLREEAKRFADDRGLRLHLPSARYSVDNAAMIGLVAGEKYGKGITSPLSLTVDPALGLA